jgi:protein-L-isoaspartate(D-aspartate) O-methyltransferase
MDTGQLNERMVDELVGQGRITHARVEEAFRTVRRHWFLPDIPLERVYSGASIPIRFDDQGHATSSSSEPAIMATMLEQLDPQPGDRILEVGAGTGYNAALLHRLVSPGGQVTSVDIEAHLTAAARGHLDEAGFEEVRVVAADGWQGFADGSPYDRIVATVGVWDLSRAWVDQLREGGLVVVPLWLRAGVQASVAFVRDGETLRSRSVELCGFMRLRGPHAGPESYVKVDGEWSMALDDPHQGAVELVRQLLASRPRVEKLETAASSLGEWFVSVALSERGAVRMWRMNDDGTVDNRAGLLDVDAGGVALVEGDRLSSFGERAPTSRLRAHLAAKPLDLRKTRILAVPATHPAPHGGEHWSLERREYRFVVSPPRGPL